MAKNSHSWIGNINIVKMAIVPKFNLQIQHHLFQYPCWHFSKIDKLILKLIGKCKEPRRAKIILTKKNNFERPLLYDFKVMTKSQLTK